MGAASIHVIPLPLDAEVSVGDDLAELLEPSLRDAGARGGDVVVVTQKVVSKAEGRIVPSSGSGRAGWIERESTAILARRGELMITRTRHGFVCANAGVDASNVQEGFVSLLPEDPDGSAERIRAGLRTRLAADLAVVVTDTFGRPWRQGVVNVAIGVAGLPAVLDLRGTADHHGRELEATVIALADEIAAAGGLAMPKAGRIPAVLLRGLDAAGPAGRASDLVRPTSEDLFPESPLVSIIARRTIRRFGPGSVSRLEVEEAVRAACTAPAPHHTRPWLFIALDSGPGRRRLLAAMAAAWRDDLRADGTPEAVIARRVARSDELLATAPTLLVPSVRLLGAHAYADDERAGAERDMFVLSAGAAIQNLLLALRAQGLASSWISSTLFCREETRTALGLDGEWLPMGIVAVGRPPGDDPPPRPVLDVGDHLRFVEAKG
jgi:dehydro coenzyme F420 reductase / coenzyme F420-0:L-glutamate ligase / coenzyme F420-1:gamma-L-glutamate ligase